jgi:hypothetical protein
MNDRERREFHEQLSKLIDHPSGGTHCVNAAYFSKEDKGNFMYSLLRSDIVLDECSDAPDHQQQAYAVLKALAFTATSCLVNFIELSESLGSFKAHIDQIKDEESILYSIMARAIEKYVELKEKKPVN